MLKLEIFRDQESFFFNTSDLGFESKKVFLHFLFDISLLDPYPCIRIFLLIWIQEAKILRIQRIRILSTAPW